MDSSVRDKVVLQKEAIAIMREATWAQMVHGCRSVEFQRGALLIARDDISPSDIDDIVKAARQGATA